MDLVAAEKREKPDCSQKKSKTDRRQDELEEQELLAKASLVFGEGVDVCFNKEVVVRDGKMMEVWYRVGIPALCVLAKSTISYWDALHNARRMLTRVVLPALLR